LVRHKTKIAQQEKKFSEALAEQSKQIARAESRLSELSTPRASPDPRPSPVDPRRLDRGSGLGTSASSVDPRRLDRPQSAPTITRRDPKLAASTPTRGTPTPSTLATPTKSSSGTAGIPSSPGHHESGTPSSPSLDSRVEERLKQWESAIEKRLARLGLRPPTPSPKGPSAVSRLDASAGLQGARAAGALESSKAEAAAPAGGGSLEEQVQNHVNLLREAHRLAMRQARVNAPESPQLADRASGLASPEQDLPVKTFVNPSFSPATERMSPPDHRYRGSPDRGANSTTPVQWGHQSAPSPFTKHVQALLARDAQY